MENLLNSAHPTALPRRPYQPTPVNPDEFLASLNQIEVEHEKNAEFLKNPSPAVDPEEFHKQASGALKIAQDLSTQESRGLPSARTDLAHGQEVILYGTSRLRAALVVWLRSVQEDWLYHRSRNWWMDSLLSEVLESGLYIAIGVYSSAGAGGPYLHPLILATMNMLQRRMLWCSANNDPEGINFPEMEYIVRIERCMEVDDDDPTRTVDRYIDAWWNDTSNPAVIPSYAYDPDDYLEAHRPQIQFTWRDIRPVPYAAGDMAEITLIMKTFDGLHSTWKRLTETLREHDAQLEKDRKLLAYWEDIRNQLRAHESQ